MVILKKFIICLYRTLLPISFRDSSIAAKLKSKMLRHEWIYNSDYYEKYVEGPAVRSAERIATTIVKSFNVTCVIDVGCGTGALLEALRNRGCYVFGLEYSKAALSYCYSRRLNVDRFDLEKNVYADNRTFDVAISLEVAEHLPEIASDRYVDLLTFLSRVIIFTAAPPGQGGPGHINEQPPLYWITKFQNRGFKHDEDLSQRWSESWKAAGDVESWYHKNLMIFRQP